MGNQTKHLCSLDSKLWIEMQNLCLSTARTPTSIVFSSRHIAAINARFLTSEADFLTPALVAPTGCLSHRLYDEIYGAAFQCTSMYVHWNVWPAVVAQCCSFCYARAKRKAVGGSKNWSGP